MACEDEPDQDAPSAAGLSDEERCAAIDAWASVRPRHERDIGLRVVNSSIVAAGALVLFMIAGGIEVVLGLVLLAGPAVGVVGAMLYSLRSSDENIEVMFAAALSTAAIADDAHPGSDPAATARAIWYLSASRGSLTVAIHKTDAEQVWQAASASRTPFAFIAPIAASSLAGRVTWEAQRFRYACYDAISPEQLSGVVARALELAPIVDAFGGRIDQLMQAAAAPPAPKWRWGRKADPSVAAVIGEAVDAVHTLERAGPAAVRVAAELAETDGDLDTILAAALELSDHAH